MSWGPRHEDVFARHGFRLDEDAHERWRSEAADGLEHGPESASREQYRAWERERLRRLVTACGVGPDDATRLVEDLDSASKGFTMAAYDDAAPVLGELRRRGLTVAVCSNWDWDLDRALAQSGLDGLVDVAVTSARAGARKPHPRIYRYTLERCAVAADQALFVGDSWQPDVEGPRALGLSPVHIWRDGNSSVESPPPAEGIPRIRDLWGVMDHLD